MRRNIIYTLVLLCCSNFSIASKYSFDANLLEGGAIDLTAFNKNSPKPGFYETDVYINYQLMDFTRVQFVKLKDDEDLYPCFNTEALRNYGVILSEEVSGNGKCVNLSLIDGATYDYDNSNQSLYINIPQVYMEKTKTHSRKELWDDGISALLMNHQTNYMSFKFGNTTRDSVYSMLSPGINYGSWRLRNNTSFTRNSYGESKFSVIDSYLERGLYGINSRLTIGDRYSAGEIFDSINFRGFMLSSDEKMVPSDVYSYSPIVKGIARTQARVEIKQNRVTVHEEVVSAGAFEITDINISDSSGDLVVTVWENDGGKQEFIVPFQQPVISVRQGYAKYNVMLGNYKSNDAKVFQSTVIYGLPWKLTSYGGAQFSDGYKSVSFGLGYDLGQFGGLSIDSTKSMAIITKQKKEGSSQRLRYSKRFPSTNTNLLVSSTKFDSDSFYTLSEFQSLNFGEQNYYSKSKDKINLTITQDLGKLGNLSVSGNRYSYWNSNASESTLNLSYFFPVRDMSFSVSYAESSHTKKNNKFKDKIAALWVSIPLDSNTRTSYRYTDSKSDTRGANHSLSLSGNTHDRKLNWKVGQRINNDNKFADNGDIDASYYGRLGQFGANYSYSKNSKLIGFNLNGGIVAHKGGIVIGQRIGNTVALVNTDKTAGVKVFGAPGVETGANGFIIQSNLNPYQYNNISIDPDNIENNFEITQTEKKVVPTEGSVVPVFFKINKGFKVMFDVTQSAGNKVPFGSVGSLVNDTTNYGIVDDNGILYMSGLPERGVINIKSKNGLCHFSYDLTVSNNTDASTTAVACL